MRIDGRTAIHARDEEPAETGIAQRRPNGARHRTQSPDAGSADASIDASRSAETTRARTPYENPRMHELRADLTTLRTNISNMRIYLRAHPAASADLGPQLREMERVFANKPRVFREITGRDWDGSTAGGPSTQATQAGWTMPGQKVSDRDDVI